MRVLVETKADHSQDRFLALLYRWKAAQFPDTSEKIAISPIANYSERNLFDFVRSSGFVQIHLELHIDMLPSIFTWWEVFLAGSPHPWAPPLKVILKEQFTPEGQQFFEQIMRPIVESPGAVTTKRVACLNAEKRLG